MFLKDNWLYFLLYVIALLCATYYLLNFDKVTLHVKINSLAGNSAIDTFFKFFTHIGDGVFAVILGVIILLYNIRNGIYILLSYIISGLFTSILKNYFFDHINRPHFVFGYFVQKIKLHYIEGVDMVGQNSFPSGHSTSAFAVFTCLALLSKNKSLKILFFIIALTAAFSRTYLSQHWLVDITIGSIIGTIAAVLFYFILIQATTLQNFNKPLLIFKKY